MEKVTVLIPVGPVYSAEWLREAFESAISQTYPVDEVLIIDDGANLEYPFYPGGSITMQPSSNHKQMWFNEGLGIKYNIWKSPCNVGFTAAFNMGMALANNDLVFYLASDDKMLPHCIDECIKTYLDNDKKDAWYSITYDLSENGICEIPMNVAMITKGLWKMVGGFPPAGFVGADAMVLSCLLAHAPDRIIKVTAGKPTYWMREHDLQETKTHTWNFVSEMTSIRGKVTKAFKFK